MAKNKQQFNKRYEQYITEFEANPDDDDDLEGVFEALITDDIDNTGQPQTTPDSASFFTSCSEVNLNQAYEMINTLANQITEYALIQPDIEPTAYFTDRYLDSQFTRVIVDTGIVQISTTNKC